jgi:hypothetical protein
MCIPSITEGSPAHKRESERATRARIRTAKHSSAPHSPAKVQPVKLADVEAILRALNDAEARYLIVGGLAVVAHGYVRTTEDIDIVLKLESGNVSRAMHAIEAIGYQPLVPVSAADFANDEIREMWRQEKNMIVFQMMNPDRPSTRLDIFVSEPFDFEREYALAEPMEVVGIPSPVVRIEALLAMKEEAGRAKDLGDIGELRKLLHIRDDERRQS